MTVELRDSNTGGRECDSGTDGPAGDADFFDPTAVRARPQLLASERRLVLAAVDLLIVNVALAIALFVLWRDVSLTLDEASPVWFLALSGAWLLVASPFGCYDLRVAAGRKSGGLAVARAGVVAIGAYFLLPYISAPLLYSRASMLAFVVIALLLLGVWRTGYASAGLAAAVPHPCAGARRWVGRQDGGGRDQEPRGSEYELVGYIDDDPLKRRGAAGRPAGDGQQG